MSEMLMESYQNGIYWAAVNAERARETAAEIEQDYWRLKIDKEGLNAKSNDVASVECPDGPGGSLDDGYRARIQEAVSHEVNMSTDYLSNPTRAIHPYSFDATGLVERIVTAILSVQP